MPTQDRRGTLTPLAAAFTRVARLINDEDLPDAAVTVSMNGQLVVVNATYGSLAENTVRRWAQAVDAVVYEQPHEFQGAAATYFHAHRVLDGVSYAIYAYVPIEPLCSAVGRTDEVRNDASRQVLATVGGA